MSTLRDGVWTMSVNEFYDDQAVAWDRAWELAKSYHKPLAEIQVHNPYRPMMGEHTFSEFRNSSMVGYECSCGSGHSGPIGSPWGEVDPWTSWHKHYLNATREMEDPFLCGALTRPKRWWQRWNKRNPV